MVVPHVVEEVEGTLWDRVGGGAAVLVALVVRVGIVVLLIFVWLLTLTKEGEVTFVE